MPIRGTMTLSQALATAIGVLRDHLGDPMARIGVLAPSSTNASLARQQLALAGPVIRVDFLTAERVVLDRGHAALAAEGLRAEPPGWLSGTVRAFLGSQPEALGKYAETLSRSGWSQPLTSALRRLEEAGVAAKDLRALQDTHADVLATVLEHVTEQRGETWASLPEMARASLSGESPFDGIQAVVVLGRHRLAPCIAKALAPWLEDRPGVLIDLGLGAVEPSTASLIDPVQKLRVRTSPDTEVASTPDEVRECREGVRAVLDAVREGIPLDRLAVAVADTSQLEVKSSKTTIGPPYPSGPRALAHDFRHPARSRAVSSGSRVRFGRGCAAGSPILHARVRQPIGAPPRSPGQFLVALLDSWTDRSPP